MFTFTTMKPKFTQIENPGAGDCGYYAFEIGMLPSILEELRTIAKEMNVESLADLFKDERQKEFFNHLDAKKGSVLYKMYSLIENKQAIFDTPDNIGPSDVTEQKQKFYEWLSIMSSISDIKDISEKRYLAPLRQGVYFLRTALTNYKIDLAQNQVIGTLKANLNRSIEQQKESKELVKQMTRLKELRDRDTKKILTVKETEEKMLLELQYSGINIDIKLHEEMDVAKRTPEENRVIAFQKSYFSLNRADIHSDVLTVLKKHMGLLGLVDDTKSDTMKNTELNLFTKDFVKWWKKNNDDNLPDSNSKEFYTMQMIFIACLYGNIPFDEQELKTVRSKVDEWWQQPSLHEKSLVIDLANVVKKMGTWATETDLFGLADVFNFGLNVVGKDIGFQEPEKKTICVENVWGGMHWVTQVTETGIPQLPTTKKPLLQGETSPKTTVNISFEDGLQFKKNAIKIQEQLNSYFELLKEKVSDEKQKIVNNWITILTKCKDTKKGQTHEERIDNILTCKVQFMKDLEKGMKDSSGLIMSILITIKDLFCSIFKIPTDTLLIEEIKRLDISEVIEENTSYEHKKLD